MLSAPIHYPPSPSELTNNQRYATLVLAALAEDYFPHLSSTRTHTHTRPHISDTLALCLTPTRPDDPTQRNPFRA